MRSLVKKALAAGALSLGLSFSTPVEAAPVHFSQTYYPHYYYGSPDICLVKANFPFLHANLVKDYLLLNNYQIFPNGQVTITPYSPCFAYYITVTAWDDWGLGHVIYRYHNKYNGTLLYEYTVDFDDYYDMYPALLPIFATDPLENAIYLHAILDALLRMTFH